ncbi:ferredoxin-NADP reductase/Na+-translocating ferredoxin:NAD+ oxidoreductase RnfD subunit [Arthrobacter pascens]|uniref:ferredoxin--NADP reductase n=1 Tax=Arthrobacter pascens TaxID=1677 RepID=UPI00279420CA|nr:oxidoreductase [Arthrobacter pascens]MDQ0677850.1 ferredoxin-NADP reductase/Na+-translocating ferredoxin:NAD+ oxidoreductase RnfD subunit [Arthrobacter pascens]
MNPVDAPKTRASLTPAARLDTVLGRFTMYRLILLVLATLAAYSILLNALGWLTFGIPQMLVHLLLCLGLTYASNRALAAVFRVRPHSESSLITGLLLYFLFWPTFVDLEMWGVALACVLASASKYALAWRGRHIFNPAAAGAFVTGLTGLNIATWWAATPAMLWLLVPGVLVVLYRTRKFLMAAAFTVVATAIVFVELLQAGMTPGMGLWQPLAQRPLLFFVGFMLTEPLTLPPRRWQQLVFAAVVGVLFAVPYNFGFVANSPELALLVGNLLAFLVGQRGGLRLRFTGTRALTPTTTEFAFEPSRRVRFVPGQYMELDLPHAKSDGKGRRRVFSLTSAPDSGTVKFGVRTAEPLSAAKKVLLALEPGDQVTATSVGGDFVLPRDPSTPVLLIAAGIGITPYLAHLASGATQERDTVLLLLARNAEEIGYAEELRTSGARILARLADGSEPPSFITNAGTASPDGSPASSVRLDGASLKALVPDIGEREVYVSGSPASVASLRRAARKAGARRVHVDSFAGY